MLQVKKSVEKKYFACMYVLGISAFYHDSAAAILKNGELIAAAQEERFSRRKHDARFPVHAIRYCLQEAGIEVDQLHAISFYDKPLLKFERLLETYYEVAPRGLASFIKAMPVWVGEKLFLKKVIRDGLAAIAPFNKKKLRLLFPEHHLSHAASAFYPSPFEEAAILTIDGVGEWATTTICRGKGREIEVLQQMNFPDSLGLLYSAFTYYLGFKVNSGEYKLMGLAPYGIADADETKKFIEIIRNELIQVFEDGSLRLNQRYFQYRSGLRMTHHRRWKQLFGFGRRNEQEPLAQHHCNLAYAIQQVTEEIVLRLARHARAITGCTRLCLAGGVALNCVANGILQRSGIFEDIFIQPAAGDAGGAAGAAWAAGHLFFEQERLVTKERDAMQGAYLGPAVTAKEIQQLASTHQASFRHYASRENLYKEVAALLAQGKVVGWVQGRMEFGPRALGNRSILADPRQPDMQAQLNLKIKFREGFRPFAPAVLAEAAPSWFTGNVASPYMLLVAPIQHQHRWPLPAGYAQMCMQEKLKVPRSTLPSVTHVDFSARIQTVHAATNPVFHALLQAFQQQTGCPVLINTSFNVRGEPPVCTAAEAYTCFMRTGLDYLVIEDYLFDKTKQTSWQDPQPNWQAELLND